MEKVGHCKQCRDFSESELCATCASGSREPSLLCAVENPADRLAIEQATGYRGLYFVLQGGCRRSTASVRANSASTCWRRGWRRAR
jgi:recombinational DNA repair protein RecR